MCQHCCFYRLNIKTKFLTPVELGQLFVCGCNEVGELGLGDTQDRTTLSKLDALRDKKIHSIAFGDRHAAALLGGISRIYKVNITRDWRVLYLGVQYVWTTWSQCYLCTNVESHSSSYAKKACTFFLLRPTPYCGCCWS